MLFYCKCWEKTTPTYGYDVATLFHVVCVV